MKKPDQIVEKIGERVRIKSINQEPSLTQQQFKDQCDINNIIKRYRLTGEITHVSKKKGHYGDYSEVPDYQTAMEIVIKADTAFNELPASLRKRFGNSPAELLSFISDPANQEEAAKLGLLNSVVQTDNNKNNQAATEQKNVTQNTKKSIKQQDKKILQESPPSQDIED